MFVSQSVYRAYLSILQDISNQVARKLGKAKTPQEVEMILRTIEGSRKFDAVVRRVATKMILSANKQNSRQWRKVISDFEEKYKKQGLIATALRRQLKGELGKVLTETIEENYFLIKSIPTKLGSQAKEEMHRLVQANVVGGMRASKLTEYLEGQGFSRAELIAKTATGQASTALTKGRSEAVGVVAYFWLTASDERVRSDHEKMNKVIVFWDEMPVPGQFSGTNARPVHAGTDFRCRCEPQPIVFWDLQVPSGFYKVWHDGRLQTLHAKQIKAIAIQKGAKI